MLDVVGRRADPTVVEARRADPRSIYTGSLCIGAALRPGIYSVWYQTEWEGSGNRSAWARESRWAVVGTGAWRRSLRGAQ